MRFPLALSGKKIISLLLFLPALALGTGILIQRKTALVFAEERTGDLHVLTSAQGQIPVHEPVAFSQAERVMRTLSEAYPERIGPAVFRISEGSPDGDWAFQVRGTWFYYAEGRLLPERLRLQTANYRALGFNSNYPAELPPWESTAEQRAARTRSYEENRNRPPQPQTQTPRPTIRRPNYFYEALWGSSTRDEARSQQEQVNFLGFSLNIHSDLSHIVRQINEIIMAESRTNPAVRQWINSLGTITGWNWRNVASSGNRSFHSYGIAIDILPRNLEGLATYWLWTSQYEPQWWNIPYSGRWHPPDFVIKTFEAHGFTWGGKWGNFDTMHFEYRPESFILSGLPLVNLRSHTD